MNQLDSNVQPTDSQQSQAGYKFRLLNNQQAQESLRKSITTQYHLPESHANCIITWKLNRLYAMHKNGN